MKLPRFFRKFMPFSMVSMALAMAAWLVSGSLQSNWLSKIAGIVFGAAVVVFIITFIGLLVVRDIENALLRRFGTPATAMVLEIAGTNERVNNVGVYRIRLEVQPASGGSFKAVAEEALRMVNMVNPGNTVSVKYDPRTKEVALVLPHKMKWKRPDF
jgi:hypothetical protein